jgi:hypothetical protein
MSTTKVKQGKSHNVQEYIMKSRAIQGTTYSNGLNIEVMLMPIAFQKRADVVDVVWKFATICGGEEGLYLCKRILLVM